MTKFNFGKILAVQKGKKEYSISLVPQYYKKQPTGTILRMAGWLADELEFNGKILEFLSDPSKKAIAFRVLSKLSVDSDQFKKKTMRFITPNASGYVQVGVSFAMDSIGAEQVKGTVNLPLKQYDDQTYEKVFYFQVEKIEDDIKPIM